MDRKRKHSAIVDESTLTGPVPPWPLHDPYALGPQMALAHPQHAQPLFDHGLPLAPMYVVRPHSMQVAMPPQIFPTRYMAGAGGHVSMGQPPPPQPPQHQALPPVAPVEQGGEDASEFSVMREPTRESMRSYLEAPEDKTVVIFNSRVAQKSYGNEKRFLCPPPCLYFVSNNWKFEIDTNVPTVFIGIDEAGGDSAPIAIEPGSFCAAKNLFISDSDKRKNFSLYAKLQYAARDLGVFKSRPIKVISKPSKKKQSTKNTDMCIPFGTDVSLFNRIRSQTISTRYLRVVRGAFAGSGSQWSALTVLPVGDDGRVGKGGGLLQYGHAILLRCAITGAESERLIVRKVDKNNVLLDGNDHVSQLHKVAFQLASSLGGEPQFLGLRQDAVASVGGTMQPDGKSVGVDDIATWTIIGTDKVRYTFCESLGPVSSPITPVPLVEELKPQTKLLVELHGENFTPNLKVWFADAPAETLYRCAELLLCTPPPIGLIRDCKWTYVQKRTEVRLFLVRDDGVVYKTDVTYTYAVERPPVT
eukprot:Opistho-1_new@92851